MIVYHEELIQGSTEWHAARCGLLTASEMKLIITPTLKVADNDKSRAHEWELLAQRITGYVEPQYVSDDMLRGQVDEVEARDVYAYNYAKETGIQNVGFVTNDKWGFKLGYSPDALVGEHGLIECKSRRQKFQVQTIIDGSVPADFMIQCQTGLLVTERKWLDFVSYSGGLPMFVVRCLPIPETQEAIVNAATVVEKKIALALSKFKEASKGLIPTERRIEQEMYLGDISK